MLIEGAILSATSGSLVNSFQSDLNSGSGQQVAVDLAALRQYFFDIHQVLEDFNKTYTHLEAHRKTQCMSLSEIPGIARAMEATDTAAMGDAESMVGALQAVRIMLAQHLNAVADTYKAYVKVDLEKAAELKGAANSSVGKVDYGMPGTTSTGSGSGGLTFA